jgi:predicted negative regulator of RcsB-dependent stress response
LEDHQVAGARLSRHELKTQDEITTSLRSFTEILESRKKEVLIAVAAVVFIAAAIVGWRAYSGKRNAAASVQLAAAITAFEDPTIKPEKTRYEKAAAEAQKTIDAYGSTSAAVIARYYLAMSQERLGDTATAEKNMQEVVDRADASMKGVAQFALAQLQAKHGGASKAIDTLTQLYNSGNYPKSAVAFDLAGLYEADGKQKQAEEYYGKIITESPDSRFRQDSEAALKRMGATIPAPPAPVPAKK